MIPVGIISRDAAALAREKGEIRPDNTVLGYEELIEINQEIDDEYVASRTFCFQDTPVVRLLRNVATDYVPEVFCDPNVSVAGMLEVPAHLFVPGRPLLVRIFFKGSQLKWSVEVRGEVTDGPPIAWTRDSNWED